MHVLEELIGAASLGIVGAEVVNLLEAFDGAGLEVIDDRHDVTEAVLKVAEVLPDEGVNELVDLGCCLVVKAFIGVLGLEKAVLESEEHTPYTLHVID